MEPFDNTSVSLNPTENENTSPPADSTSTQETSANPPIDAGSKSTEPIIGSNSGENTIIEDTSEPQPLNEILGTEEKDELIGTDSNDWIQGFQGQDTLIGGAGNDKLEGELGSDELDGGSGDDYLLGGNGRDNLLGGQGNDTLVGGLGGDNITGGEGQDTFVYEQFNDGLDVITDFSSSEDKLDLTTLFTNRNYTGTDPVADGYLNYELYEQGGTMGTIVQFDSDGSSGDMPFFNLVFLQNVTPDQLNATVGSENRNIIF
ncbi:MAG TPA: type I secretion C-terminal target domain-containing protein [Coleofasciculaceae cyanobacterium]